MSGMILDIAQFQREKWIRIKTLWNLKNSKERKISFVSSAGIENVLSK